MNIQKIIAAVKAQVSLKQDGLRLFQLNIDHEPENSRLVVTGVAKIGVDFKSDTIEKGIGYLAESAGLTSDRD